MSRRLFVGALSPWAHGYEVHLSEVVTDPFNQPVVTPVGVTQCAVPEDAAPMARDFLELHLSLYPHELDVAVVSTVWEDARD